MGDLVATLVADPVAVAYVSWGIWVARCPTDGCPNAEHFGADRTTGHVGGLTMDDFTCRHCGMTCPAAWPEPQVAADVVRLLAMRPVPATRSWLPGELPENLLTENIVHGLIARDELPATTGTESVELMSHGRMVPFLRELVTAKARQVLAAERARGALVDVGRLLEIGA